MVWLLTIASLIGFLAVDYLANQPVLANLDDKTWLILSVLLAFILFLMLITKRWMTKKYRVSSQSIPFRKINFLLNCLYCISFGATLLISSSFGLYQYQKYQQSLIKSPLTIDAIVQSTQISDTIAQTIDVQNQKYLIGNGYSRQLLKVMPVDKTQYSVFNQPINVLVSTNVVEHPEWEKRLNRLQPGQQLQAKLQLQPIHRQNTQQLPQNAKSLNLGFDEEQWLRQRNVQAKGIIVDIQQNSLSNYQPFSILDNLKIRVEKLRWDLRQKLITSFSQKLAKSSISLFQSDNEQNAEKHDQTISQNYAILLGLLTGDKSLMDSQIKYLYQVSGISHLLAISGPHVLLLASIIATLIVWLVKGFVPKLLVKLPSSLLVLWVSMVVAGFYAMLVGFEIPAQRTFWMLVLLTLSKQWLINLSPFKLLACIALGMMWFDTTAVVQAGFWLSFIAVGLLLKFSEQVGEISQSTFTLTKIDLDNKSQTHLGKLFDLIVTQTKILLKLQIWLFVWMMPIVIWFFGKVSMVGILTNLFAVPFLGLIIVPLDMLAGVLSWLPLVGQWLSGQIWSLLSSLLQGFHGLLTYLVEGGFAKQSFFALSKSQLVLYALIGAVWFLRGLLPRMLILPLLLLLILLPIQQQKISNEFPSLAVMDNPKMGITLLVKGQESWLILADNQIQKSTGNQSNLPKSTFFNPKTVVKSVTTDEEMNRVLTNEIYPLLASQHISKLTGVISQTPSIKANQIVQKLANSLPVKQYWLAGYDAVNQNINGLDKIEVANFDKITPKNCQTAQTWQIDNLVIKAVSGWQLDLPLTDDEKLATQNCFIQITHQPKATKPFSTLLLAGDSALTMQMSEKLCIISQNDFVVSPYHFPIQKSWLALTQPNIVHVLTGDNSYQKLSEDSQLSLTGWQSEQPNLQTIYSDQVGAVIYQLTEAKLE